MIIKYCKNCLGEPYTKRLDIDVCPMCGNELKMISVDETELALRDEFEQSALEFSRKELLSENDEGDKNLFELDSEKTENKLLPNISFYKHTTLPDKGTLNEPYVVGKLTRYSKADEDSGYKRLFIGKIIDAIFYKQRMEDVLHRFTVRVDCGKDALGHNEFKDIPVNVHGVIASGLQLDENCDVEVKGKYKNNVLMASEINVLNSGFKSKVHFQHSRGAIAYGILAIIALIFFIYVGLSSDGGFFANIKEFFVVWLVSAVVITILYFALFLSKLGVLLLMGKKKSFPFVGILLCSFICALLFMNVFGLGTGVGDLFSGWLSSIMPIIITIIALIVVVCLVIKR